MLGTLLGLDIESLPVTRGARSRRGKVEKMDRRMAGGWGEWAVASVGEAGSVM
jgi:hypothetical protein